MLLHLSDGAIVAPELGCRQRDFLHSERPIKKLVLSLSKDVGHRAQPDNRARSHQPDGHRA